MTKQTATRRFTVSHRHDPAEVQAEKAARVVAGGGKVSGWSFGSVPVSAAVHRDETEDERKPPEADKETKPGKPGDVLKALAATTPGKQLTEAVKERPEVKAVEKLFDSKAAKVIAGLAGVAGMGAAYAGKSDVMSKVPDIPLGTVRGYDVGLSPSVKSPAGDSNTFGVMISLTPGKEKPKTKSSGPPQPDPLMKGIQDAQADPNAAFMEKYQREQLTKRLPLLPRPKAPSTGWTFDPTQKPPTEPQPGDQDTKKKEEEPVQREPVSASECDVSASESAVSASESDSSIERAVSGGGRPLEASTRRSMETRFGHDFSGVRIHDHASASSAAAGISAKAFTVGEDIVFGAGGYDPNTPQGRYLLAHELAHVIQRRGQGGDHVHRRTNWEAFTIWLGAEEGDWSEVELQAYLAAVTAADVIDGAYDADNKARAIVTKWKSSSPGFNLSARQKVLLIAEMLDGPTRDEDENAILDLLESSDATDLRVMLTAPEMPIERLESDLDGEENDRLDAWVAAHFEGGRDAVAAGRITVLGDPIPQSAPPGRFAGPTVDGWFASGRSWQEIVALIERMKDGDKDRTLAYLIETRRPQLTARLDRAEAAAPDASPYAPDDPAVAGAKVTRLVTDRVLLHFFAGAVPATEADLISLTHPARPKRAQQMKDALVPTKPGTVFDAELDGEAPETYETKLAARMDTMVALYYDDLVTAAPPRTHTLSEFETMAKLAKGEVDHVFLGFYPPDEHPPFVADQTDPAGKITKAGTLHDQYANLEAELAGHGPSYHRESAMNLLRYFFVANRWVRRLDAAHGASPSFDPAGKPTNAEAEAQERVGYAYLDATPADTNIKRINDIDRAWFGKAGHGDVYVSLIQPADPVEDRLLRWRGFQMLIHEYMHTLTHLDYRAYAESFGRQSAQYNTLMEGVDCVLSEVVWEHVAPKVTDPDIRLAVEGADYSKLPPIEVPHASYRRYPSYSEALALANIGGIQAVYAAFFLGRVERIGGPPHHPGLDSTGGKP